MSTFYAQPYDINAKGFFFDCIDSYRRQSAGHVNRYGMPVEEYELQFIDGDLSMDYGQTNIAGRRFIYRSA